MEERLGKRSPFIKNEFHVLSGAVFLRQGKHLRRNLKTQNLFTRGAIQ